jgi:hypothetical protein
MTDVAERVSVWRTVPESDLEAFSRLTSVLSVCEHELASLEALADRRLTMIIERMHAFRLELIAALEALNEEG